MGFLNNILTNTGANIDQFILDSNFFNSQTIGTVIKVQTNNGLVSYKKNEKNHWIKEKPKFIEKPTSETVIAPFSPDLKLPFKSVDNKNYYILLKDLNNQFFDLNDLDPFGDGSQINYYKLDNNLFDEVKKTYASATDSNSGTWTWGADNKGVSNSAIVSSSTSQVKTLYSNTTSDSVTVSAWIKWNGFDSGMPFGFQIYDIDFYNNSLGFNTGDSDIYGLSSSGLSGVWKHITAVFNTGSYVNNKIYIDGQSQALSQKLGSIYSANVIIKNAIFYIFGFGANANYRNIGSIANLRMFNKELTQEEVTLIYNYDNLK